MARKISSKAQEAAVKRITEITKSEIKKMTAKEAKALLGAVRQEVNERMEKLGRASSKNFYSSAYEKQKDWIGDHFDTVKKSPSKTRREEAVAELQRAHDFLNAKSSRVSGAREIMRQQDERIFGINEKTGKPNAHLTRDQRELLWSLYDEFLTGEYTASKAALRYSSLQSDIGKYIKERKRGKSGKYEKLDFETAYEELRKRLFEDGDYDTSDSSILDGRGIDF